MFFSVTDNRCQQKLAVIAVWEEPRFAHKQQLLPAWVSAWAAIHPEKPC